MAFIRENFGIIFMGLSMFRHFHWYFRYRNDPELKKNFYVVAIVGIILLGLVIVYRFTTIVSLNVVIVSLLVGAIIMIPFEPPLRKRHRKYLKHSPYKDE